MQILKVIFVVLEVVLLFNLLIFVHELGHFLAARWRGLKVERFAIWFGKPIWKKKIGGVEYVLGTIPAGGYVSLPQMAPMDLIEGKSETKKEKVTTNYGASVWTKTEAVEDKPGEVPAEALPNVSALDKIIVAFAGPLFSFGLACAFAVVVWMVGRPVTDAENTTTVGFVKKDGPAFKAGIKPGDVIQTVDNQTVSKFSGFGPSVTWRIVRSEGATIPVVVKRGDQTLTFVVTPSHEATKAWERKSLRKIQIGPAGVAKVDSFYTNSPAVAAGLKKGDYLLAANGAKVYSPDQFNDFIEENGTKPVTLTIKRDGKESSLVVKPEVPMGVTNNLASVGIDLWDTDVHLVYPDPVSQVSDGLGMMAGTFGALFDRKSEIKAQHLGGAVKILSIYYTLFQDENGWRMALWFSVVMNINLALLNMLPLPVLDGGHITLALIEAARRRPANPKVLGYIQTGFAVLLITYMLYLAFFDVQDLFPHKGTEPTEIRFSPKS
jgi:regulator of sigma E protease